MATKITSFRRLSLVGGLAIVASTIVNLIIRIIALTWLNVSPEFAPIGIGPVIFWSIIGGIGAVLVFYLITRLSRQPLPVYVIIAFLVYVCTFIPDEILLSRNPPIFPGTTAEAVVVLMAMHAAEATIMLLTLVLAGRPKTRSRPQ
ncbi:MAG: hypothetical protein JO215_04370 [Ktedonobacteraceae bacterium]|nr:hypothetical protein [Ktedonobacteraceae bacterium]MBV9710403.1 hypothetical protein [Ktedonobacteraceae bacterium]